MRQCFSPLPQSTANPSDHLFVHPRRMPSSAVIFTAASAVALYKKQLDGGLSEDGVDDRAFRIVKNSGQVKVDQYALAGASVGAALGAVVGRTAVRAVLSSSLTGVAAGVALYSAETIVLPKLKEMGAL